VLRKKLAEAESSPNTIEEWQKRLVRLDRNQRQSRAKKKMCKKTTLNLTLNALVVVHQSDPITN